MPLKNGRVSSDPAGTNRRFIADPGPRSLVGHASGGAPVSREDARTWVQNKRRIQADPVLLSLAAPFLAELSARAPTHCQVALRFPGERAGDPLTWHVDKGRFDVLVGVYLTDNLLEDHGNFVVYSMVVAGTDLAQGITQATHPDLNVGPPTQILAPRGSALVVDRRLCHGTAGNLTANYTRQVVWYRLYLNKRATHATRPASA